MSFQSNAGRGGDWAHSEMVVAIGTENAESFSRTSVPFEVPDGRRAQWNSLFVKDGRTVTALSSTNAYKEDRQELYVIDGHVIPEPRAARGAVQVDGAGSEEVWSRSTEIFAGARGSKSMLARAVWNEQNLYLRFQVKDDIPNGETDAVVAAWAVGKIASDAPVEGVFRLELTAAGAAALSEGDRGNWQTADVSRIDTAVSVPTEESGTGMRIYTIEAAEPWNLIGGRPAGPFGLTLGLVDDDGDASHRSEWVSATHAGRPTSWLRASLLE